MSSLSEKASAWALRLVDLLDDADRTSRWEAASALGAIGRGAQTAVPKLVESG